MGSKKDRNDNSQDDDQNEDVDEQDSSPGRWSSWDWRNKDDHENKRQR